MIYFVDTNIFLRFLVADDTNHHMRKECAAFFSRVKDGHIRAITSSHVLAEIVWVLHGFYQFSKQHIISAVHAGIGIGIDIQDGTDTARALWLYERYNVKFIDCLIASHPAIIKGDVIVVSYDKDFDTLGVIRKEPRQIV